MEFGPEAITIGSIQFRYYGIILVTAILVAAFIADRLAKRDGRDPDHLWGALFWAVILGIIGARLWYVLFPPISMTAGCGTGDPTAICRDTAWYFENFFNLQDGAIAIWAGGLSIFGAFIGGGLGGLLYLLRAKQPILPWLDIAAVAIPVGQAIGRIANYVNQELYGIPTELPWGIQIDTAHRLGEYASTIEYPPSTLFHPMWAYEALWSLAAFFVLRYVFIRYRQVLNPGTLFWAYLAQYAVIRFLLEFIRVEVALVGGVNVSQIATGAMFVVAALMLIINLRQVDGSQRRPPAKAEAGKAAPA